MSFRVPVILWSFALLAAAVATLGSWGILAAIAVAHFWAAVHNKQTRTVLDWVVIFGVSLVIAALLFPPFDIGRGFSRHLRCLNNVKQLSAALMRYTQRGGALPAAATADSESRPSRSWRVTILRDLDEHWLFDQYRSDEPW